MPTPEPTTSQEGKPPASPLKSIAGQKAGALQPDDSVQTAGERMREHGAQTWPVVQDRKLVGEVEEQNPDWNLGGHGHDPKSWRVGGIMSRNVAYCYEDEDCARARQLMDELDLNYLPVVDRDMRIVGIFSREEVEQKMPRPSPRAEPPPEESGHWISKL